MTTIPSGANFPDPSIQAAAASAAPQEAQQAAQEEQGVPVQPAAAMQTLASQRAAINTSRADVDPTSAAVLKKFMETQGRGRSAQPSEAPMAPIYGAPIRHPKLDGLENAPSMMIYGAPILHPKHDTLDQGADSLGKHKEEIPPEFLPLPILPDAPGKLPWGISGHGQPIDEAPIAPIYGAPVRHPHDQLPPDLTPAPAEPIYGAPIRFPKGIHIDLPDAPGHRPGDIQPL